MRPLRSILLYFAVVLIGGAVVAPWLFFLARWAAIHINGCESWANIPFHRFVHRSFIVFAIIGLPSFLRSVGLDGKTEFRAALRLPGLRPLLEGIAVGFISLGLVVACQLLYGTRVWRSGHAPGEICRFVVGALATALTVAILEELLFRWALYGSLRKIYAKSFAVFLSSAFYALVHFFSRPEAQSEVNWASGLALLPRMLRGFADFNSLMPGYFNLLLVGSILAIGYELSGRLWLSIGLHAGWIFWLKSYGFWTLDRTRGSGWFWGSEKLIDGILASFVLIGTLVIVKRVAGWGNSKETVPL